MAGDTDTQGTDDPRAKKDAGSPKKQKLPAPGKTTNGDTAGVTPAVPGKRTNTDGMGADGAPGVGKTTQVDEGKDGADAKSVGAGGGGGGGGADKKAADGDHNAAAADDAKAGAPGGGKGKGKGANGATGKNDKEPAVKAKAPANGDEAKAGGAVKEGAPLHDPKMFVAPQRVDAPAPSAIPNITLGPPKANKNLSDTWVKETGRTVEQHHEQIANALTAIQTEIQSLQTALITSAESEAAKVTGEITAKVDGFKSTLVAPGKQRVETAYAGLGKGFETAEQKALADIAKNKATGKAAIDTAKKTNGDGISKKIVAAKAMVGQTVAKNVPAASGAIKKWAGGIPTWVKAAKDQAKTASEAAAKNFNPSKGNAGSKDSAFIALEEDVKKNHTLKHGEKLGKQYEGALVGWSKDTDKKADELVRKALDTSKVEFEAALDTADSASKKGFDEALKGANATLDTGETTAKKAVTDSKTNGIKKFEAEKKDAVDAADKAGKELADNSNAAGTELTDRIKKKAADDAKNYAAIVADLQKKFAGGKPMKFEDAKPKIDAAKAQVTKLHETNTNELKTLVTEGKGALLGTLTKQSDIFEKAIKDREVSAKKTEQDVIKDIGKGAETMSASLGNIGKTFTDVTEKESKRVDAMVTAFNQNADAATKDFGTKISAHLEGSRKGLEDNLKANLEPAKMAEDTQGGIQQEVASKKKSLDTDTGTLRSAMDGWGTDENKIYGVLRKCSHGEITYLEASYQDHYPQRAKGGNNALRADFAEEMSGNDLKTAMSYLNHDRATAIKLELADSKGFWNDDEARIEEVLRGASEEEIKFLNTDPEAIKVVNDVKGNLGGADLDLMTTLLDTSIDKDDRKVKADAISLFQTMDGLGTDEAKMKKLLSDCKTEEERTKLRAQFNQYAKSKGWDGGDGSEGNDALTLAIKDDVGTGLLGDDKGEQNHMLALASVKRDEDDIKAAKMVEGADGGGTNEDAIFEALDDEEYAKKWAAASPADKKKLEEARRKMLDAKVAKMSGGKWDSAQGLIDDEMDKANLTYGEFVDGKRENGSPLTAAEIARVKSRDPGINKLQWMVAQRKLQTGQAEPELMLAYAMWGVTGTDEDAIKKVFGPEPKPIASVKAITGAFAARWGVPLVSHCELEDMKRGAPTGALANELSGKDWFATRMLLAGKPETAEQLKYISDQRKQFNKGGGISGALMDLGEAVGFTEAKSTAEATEARFDKEYAAKFGKNPTAKLGTADSKTLEELADYLQQDYEAYSASLNSIVDGIVMALEIVGGVIITVVTAGTASPVLAAIIANLVLSAGTITFKYAALGDQYGAAELGADIVKAVGTSAFAGLGELKALTNITQQAGTKVAGGVQKLSQLANQAATKAGMKLGQKGALEMGEQATTKLAGIVAAGTKNVILGAGQEVYGALTDEKTYDKKFGEALWGEDSIGAKILKGIPKSFAEGAVTQWINESAGTSNKDNAGNSTGPRSNALTNAIADMGGTTAGFFVYVDNYKDAEQFWMGLLKANANKAVSGALNGYAMHKARANKLGRDFLTGDMGHEGLAKMAKDTLDPSEIAALAKFVKQYGTPEQVAALPDAFKATLPKTETAPAAANTNTPAAASTSPATATPKADDKNVAANTNKPAADKDAPAATAVPPKQHGDDVDEQKSTKPAAGSKEEELSTKTGARVKKDDEQDANGIQPIKDNEQQKATAKPHDESAIAAEAERIKSLQESRKRMSAEDREAEVAKARAETAERDKQVVDEIHQLAPPGASKVKGVDGKEQDGPSPPVDVPKVYDSLTLGAGFAGVANMASKPAGDSLMIAAGGNPWDKAKNRFGQPVGESEVPGAKPGHGMKETASEPNARFMLASEHAANVALNKNDHQMKTYPGSAGPAEAKDPSTWPKWALESGANVRIPVVGPDGTTRYFYAKQVDVAVGPGPARTLPESVMDADTLKRMKAGEAFFLGDQGFTGNEIKPGDNVAAFGGGASAAWGVEASSKNAAHVEWIARIPDDQKRADLQAKLNGLHHEVVEARKGKDPERIKAAEKAITDFTFIEAERNGYLPRNYEPGGAFDPKKQTDQGGNISRRGIEHCEKIEYVEHEGKMQVKLTFREDHADGDKLVTVYKDKLILSIGQNAAGEGGPVGLVKKYDKQLIPIFGEPDVDGFKPVVGVQSPDGSLRILGAAATPNEISHMLDPKVMTAAEHQANLGKQAQALPADSKGVVGGFALAQKHIEQANAQLAKKVQETAEQQRTDAGLTLRTQEDIDGTKTGGKVKTQEERDKANLAGSETTNAPAVNVRAKAALDALAPADRAQAEQVITAAKTPAQKTLLERALAAGRKGHELEQLRAAMGDMSDAEIAHAFTGAGVVQFYQQSCAPTAYQIAIADVDPFFAFQLRQNPELVMDSQRKALEKHGGAQTKRDDLNGDGVPDNLQPHLADKDMNAKLNDDQSYGKGKSAFGIDMPDLAGGELHKQLETATGQQYEVVTNQAVKFANKGDGQYGKTTAPHDRIIAAVQAGHPVLVGQYLPGQAGGHAMVIVSVKVEGEGAKRVVTYTLRDPMSGTVTTLPASLMDTWGTQAFTLPKMNVPDSKEEPHGPQVAKTAGDDEQKDGGELSSKTGIVARNEQEAHPVRSAEIHLGTDTPAKPAGPKESGVRGQLDELWELRGSLKKAKPEDKANIEAQIKAKQASLDTLLTDPSHKDTLLDPHVAFALAREAGAGDRTNALHDFLRTNIDSFRKAQDQARQGADPELRAKREVFEREVAKLVMAEGAVKKQVDTNLDAMCAKAIDYITKSRTATEHESAFAGLGMQSDTGYAGAVLSGDNPAQNAKVMMDVLRGGNVRERMIALGKFAEFVANDMLNNPQAFAAAAEKSQGPAKPGQFSANEAAAYKARMEQYLKDRGWKEGDPIPTGKDYTKDFLKPTNAEKKGQQSEYQGAKSQDMDTKIPSVSTAPTDGDVFPTGSLPENKKSPGQTGAGEGSTLAKTTVTVAEAEAMGYQLSEREREIAKANGGKLPWVVGTVANVVDPSAEFIAAGSAASLPQKAGISGTTFRFMEASQLLGGDPEMSRLAMIGALQTIDAHTVYEIASASKGFGVSFDATKPYDSLGIPRAQLEELALKTGTTLAELNGETQKNAVTGKE